MSTLLTILIIHLTGCYVLLVHIFASADPKSSGKDLFGCANLWFLLLPLFWYERLVSKNPDAVSVRFHRLWTWDAWWPGNWFPTSRYIPEGGTFLIPLMLTVPSALLNWNYALIISAAFVAAGWFRIVTEGGKYRPVLAYTIGLVIVLIFGVCLPRAKAQVWVTEPSGLQVRWEIEQKTSSALLLRSGDTHALYYSMEPKAPLERCVWWTSESPLTMIEVPTSEMPSFGQVNLLFFTQPPKRKIKSDPWGGAFK